MILITKKCDNCIHNSNKPMCEKYCKSFSSHEFRCEYCIRKLSDGDKRFCEQENEDGSQNCCGDKFDFNTIKYKLVDYDSTVDTQNHIDRVKQLMLQFCTIMLERADNHDKSKLETIEKPYFDEFTPLLSASKYGTPEYMKMLDDLQVALNHHYKTNSHHPQYHENGIDGMTLFDVVEMFFDWKSSSERHDDGDIYFSIKSNKDRFKMSDQLINIFNNTAKSLKWEK